MLGSEWLESGREFGALGIEVDPGTKVREGLGALPDEQSTTTCDAIATVGARVVDVANEVLATPPRDGVTVQTGCQHHPVAGHEAQAIAGEHTGDSRMRSANLVLGYLETTKTTLVRDQRHHQPTTSHLLLPSTCTHHTPPIGN